MSDATVSRPPLAVCFGEILWDFLPDALYPGGAPFNVAYHLHQHRLAVHVASAVGRDILGDELLRRLQHWGLPLDGIARHHGLPTGYVRAALATTGDAQYEIPLSVAWDQIALGEDSIRAAMQADALIFGSLAQRSTFNQAALDRLLAVLPVHAQRIFDVNLRAPHDDLDLVRTLAARATVLKLNSDEAARVANEAPAPGHEEAHARALARSTGCGYIVVTAGARGAGLLHDDVWHWEPGRRVQVADTVGAGDAFLASLISNLLHARILDGEILARACRLGEWVATQRGATPGYGPSTPV